MSNIVDIREYRRRQWRAQLIAQQTEIGTDWLKMAVWISGITFCVFCWAEFIKWVVD